MSGPRMTCPRCWGTGHGSSDARSGACAACDGAGVVPDEQLSPHFRLSELLRSDTARTLGIPNDPAPAHTENLRALCIELLEPLRAAVGPLRVTSGLRRPALNRAVTGEPSSAHVVGWAADVVPVRGVRADALEGAMAWFASSNLAWDQVIREPTWLHVGLRQPITGAQRRELKRKDGGRYPTWTAA